MVKQKAPSNSTIAFILKCTILVLVYIIAFATRLFSVVRFESVIHEFDPYFNFRATKFLASEGFYSFHNWFDDRAWYPLGRIVGGTIYPGLMLTSAAFYWISHFFNATMNIRNICVFLSPFMSSNTAIAAYFLGKEVMHDNSPINQAAAEASKRRGEAVGLLAAAFIAIVPGYISRSVAGSFDNEGVAIWALVTTYYLWVKAVNTGSLFHSSLCALAYFYMASSWGGYLFITNLLPLHTGVMLLCGRYSPRLYVAYSTVYTLGTLLSMQVPFISFQPVFTSEHAAAAAVFAALQLYALATALRSMLPRAHYRTLMRRYLLPASAALAAGAVLLARRTGYLAPWSGRFYSLLDPTYAKANNPIIASVSEHQPTTWAGFFFDLHILVFLIPPGLYFCFKRLTDGKLFLILYAVSALYLSAVMVRLLLVLAPVACLLGAVAVTETLLRYCGTLKASARSSGGSAGRRANEELMFQKEVSLVLVAAVSALLCFYAFHCTWVSSEAYSSPSIVLSANQKDGSRVMFDDFREAYSWLRTNTPEDAKVMAWWDYGYQITSMANRTILVDNNTWNNTHIATVGRAFSSSEEDAYPILQSLDVDYVLVMFGGLTGYASDDINKFLWMVRIGGAVFPEAITERRYFTKKGQFKVGAGGSPTLLNSLMYKLCYYKFGQITTDYGKPTGYDRVRGVEIGNKDFELEHLEEAMTTEHWIVRIYKVRKQDNRA